jgi:predicted transposase YdaD
MRRNTLSPEELSIIKDEAAWEEAKQNAQREGRAEGLAAGRDKGLAEGLAEGSRKKAVEIARTLLMNKSDKNFVAQVTGLSVAEIEQIKLD